MSTISRRSADGDNDEAVCDTLTTRRGPTGAQSPSTRLQHEVDLGSGFAGHAGTGFALGIAFQHVATPQHVLTHGKHFMSELRYFAPRTEDGQSVGARSGIKFHSLTGAVEVEPAFIKRSD